MRACPAVLTRQGSSKMVPPSANICKVVVDYRNGTYQCLHSQGNLQVFFFSGRCFKISKQDFFLYGLDTFQTGGFALFPGQVSLHSSPLSVGSLFPTVLWISWMYSPWVFKAVFWGLSLVQDQDLSQMLITAPGVFFCFCLFVFVFARPCLCLLPIIFF